MTTDAAQHAEPTPAASEAAPHNIARDIQERPEALTETKNSGRWQQFREFAIREEKAMGFIFAVVGTLAGVALGASSIIVARRANQIATSQGQLMERQNVLAESQLRPLFRFKAQAASDSAGVEFELVEIFNDGGPIQVISSRNTDVIEVRKGSAEAKETRHFVGHYFGMPRFSGEGTGLVCTLEAFTAVHQLTGQRLTAHNRTAAIGRLRQELQQAGDFDGPVVRRFLALEYRDALMREESAYFEIGEWLGLADYVPPRIKRLSNMEGQRLFSHPDMSDLFSVGSLERLDLKQIINRWDTVASLGEILPSDEQ